MFFHIGLLVSAGLVFAAFEHKTYEAAELLELAPLEEEIEEILDIPVTEQLPPPPPLVEQPFIKEVTDNVEIEEKLKVDFDVVESMPHLPGGNKGGE
ncbi:hypothetical protein QWY93_01825 [Echinicola jeungdonensis]|uniref:Uncharacterized protein n=1 Tax=Echinicola jeungdonensis TaxID=709343 RepID=A0ABV5J7X7_9BACT|nr:hypothetical protein [Echinicola jeungdonensis]MDN3668075.1 hypothetical protein [Echinicola jeungdonensis]